MASPAPSTSKSSHAAADREERSLPIVLGKRRTLHLPITLSVSLMALNVTLMICWIVLLAQHSYWEALSIGVVAFALILVGLSIYLALAIKEVRLNRRQANFVDSVTHELKSPIASLKLCLDTLQMRTLAPEQHGEFLKIMRAELDRLDQLITHLLEVGRLDAIGAESEPESIRLSALIRECAEKVALLRDVKVDDVFAIAESPIRIKARRLVLELVFTNLLDNAVKYGGQPAQVDVSLAPSGRSKVLVNVSDNGAGVEPDSRNKIFKIFVRGGRELERTTKGTGLGLYIVRTLVSSMKGRVWVSGRQAEQGGAIFVLELPGVIEDDAIDDDSSGEHAR